MAQRLTFLPGRRLVNVAGESHYQEALRGLTGADGAESVRREFEAVLEPEPDNAHDPNAVRVLISDNHVGYLPRAEAAAYGPMLARVCPRAGTGRRSTPACGLRGQKADSEQEAGPGARQHPLWVRRRLSWLGVWRRCDPPTPRRRRA